jgi:PAS domain S-box-containing protein
MSERAAKVEAEALTRENRSLRLRLALAEETLRALQTGEADAVLVESERQQVYTLESVDTPYSLLVAQIPHPAVTLDSDGAIIACNHRFADLLLRPIEGLLGLSLLEIVVPVDRPILESLLREGVAADAQSEARLQRADGVPVPVYLGVRALRVGIRGLCLVATDLSEQRQFQELRRVQEALRASEERLELAQRAGRIGSFEWNIESGAVSRSAIQAELHGLPTDGSTARVEDWTRTLHPDDGERVMGEIRRVVAERTPLDIEYRVVKPDGETRWVVSKGRVYPRGERGQPLRMLGVSMDITERKQAEKELQEADRKKDEFLATLAHELRNPLAPMRNAIQILQATGPEQPDLSWAREVLDRQIQVMGRLLEDLLDVSRISRGTLNLRKEPVELASVIDVAVETSRPEIDAKGHKLTIALPSDPIHLDADPVRLAEVFSNLLNNAAKYTDGEGHIELTAVQQGAELVVSVKDTGIGIPADALTRVFELFSQAKPVGSSFSGLGIGLSLVKQLVEMHGGSIEARSDGPGRGSQFVVRLPLAESQPVREPLRAREDERRFSPRRRVLIADDNRDSADSLAMYLRVKGHQTSTAYDGEEALAAAEAIRPEVVLLDIGMPKLNGYEVCRRIREQPWGRGTLLVALTGWGQKQDQRRSEAAGFDRHLVKPIEPAALTELLDSMPAGSGADPSRG